MDSRPGPGNNIAVLPAPVQTLKFKAAVIAVAVLTAAPVAATSDAEDRFCALLDQCGIEHAESRCRDRDADLGLDASRCRPAQDVEGLDLRPWGQFGFRTYEFLAREYQAAYSIRGILPMRAAQLAILMDDLPFTARLLNHARGGNFTARFIRRGDHPVVYGERGDKFHGQAVQVAGTSGRGRMVWLGFGSATIARWTFVGEVMLDLVFRPDPGNPGRLQFEVRIYAAPGNGAIDAVMNSDLFAGLVRRIARSVLDDLAAATGSVIEQRQNGTLAPAEWSPPDYRMIDRLQGHKTAGPVNP